MDLLTVEISRALFNVSLLFVTLSVCQFDV